MSSRAPRRTGAPGRQATKAERVPRAQAVLDHAESMAVPAIVASGILEVLESTTVTSKSLAARAIRSPEISAFLLRLASSDNGTRVANLEEAVERVGMRGMATLLTSRATYRLTGSTLAYYGITRASFLRHAGEVADMSERAARALGAGALAEIAALAGTLHDLGKMVLSSLVDGIDPAKLELTQGGERELFGVDHARVGAWIGDRWGFPEQVVKAIAQHHSPTPPDGVVERSVWLGNLLVRAGSGDSDTLSMARGGIEASGLPVSAFEQLVVGGGPAEGPRRPPGLTDREVQVLRLLAEGETAKQVAHRLGCSPSTIHNHLHHVYRKLNVSGQAQALLVARENNWV
jgi:putative nucleotidyltransferase with HDIG domain